jgi:hypothetical protein
LKFTEKKMCANIDPTDGFVPKFKTKLEEVNYYDALMFNADEIGLYWERKKKVKCTLVQALRLFTGRTAHRGSEV